MSKSGENKHFKPLPVENKFANLIQLDLSNDLGQLGVGRIRDDPNLPSFCPCPT